MSCTSDSAPTSKQIVRAFRSDALEGFREISRAFLDAEEGSAASPTATEFLDQRLRPYSTRVILDANAVLKDLYFLTKTRTNPDARSALQETIDAGTVCPIAPRHLIDEVCRKIPVMAQTKNISEAKLRAHWDEMKAHIQFVEVSDADLEAKSQRISVEDPDDLPYLVVQDQTGAPIHSEDEHISKMGGTTITRTTVMHLRDYSRHASVHLGVVYSSVMSVVGAFLMATLLFQTISSAIQVGRRLHPLLQIVLVGTAIYGLCQPSTRTTLREKVVKPCQSAARTAKAFATHTALPVLMEGEEARRASREELQKASVCLP